MAAQEPQQRTTVLGLDVWEACFLALAVPQAVEILRDGVHGTWDVIVAVAVFAFLVALVVSQVVERRARKGRPARANRQDWLLTIALAALVALWMTPNDPPDGAWWPYLILSVLLGSGALLARREWRRRLTATSATIRR